MLFVLEQGEIEAREILWGYGTRLGRRYGASVRAVKIIVGCIAGKDSLSLIFQKKK